MNRILLGLAALTLLGVYAASADVLVMEDGRRIRGELISVNRGTVIFDEVRDGSSRPRRMRVNKDEVARIVLRENAADDGGDLDTMDDGPFGPGRDDTRDSTNGTGREGSRTGRMGRGGRTGDGTYGRDRDPNPDTETDSGPFGRDRDAGRVSDRPDPGNGGVSGRDHMVSVSARQPWTDTGIDVASGDVVRFVAEGTVTWSAGQQDGPAGEVNSPINDRRPIPARPAGALIGRIGTSPSDVFFIGDDRGSFRVRTSGRLYLGINDNSYGDNTGSFEVRVTR
jgi:hypothetical protein